MRSKTIALPLNILSSLPYQSNSFSHSSSFQLHFVMSRLRLAKKLKPAKKAWKSFSNTLQSKLHKLNIPKAFKITLQRLLSAFHSLIHLIKPSNKIHRSLTSTRPYTTSSYYHVQHKNNFAAIHINDLYSEPNSSMSVNINNKSSTMSTHHAHGETSRKGKQVHGNKDLHGDTGGINTIEDAWKAVVAKSPLLQVDQKAEEFIYKFREDIRLQKEKSLLEFQERLARST